MIQRLVQERVKAKKAGRQLSLMFEFSSLRYWVRVLHFGPLVVGGIVLLVFAYVDQMQQIYLGIMEGEYINGLVGLGFVVFLCALLYAWQYLLGTDAIDRAYPQHADVAIDRRLAIGRDVVSFVSATPPLLGLAAGLFRLQFEEQKARGDFTAALKEIGGKEQWRTVFREFGDTIDLLSAPFYRIVALLLVASMAMIIGVGLYRRRAARKGRVRRSLPQLIFRAGAITSAIAIVAPPLLPDYVVPLSQALGPLAMAAIVLIVLTWLLMGLSILSTKRVPRLGIRFPATGVGIGVLLILAAKELTFSLSPLQTAAPDERKAEDHQAVHDSGRLSDSFSAWIKAREGADLAEYEKRSQKYPIFIIATQGGGIYASSAAAAFLTSMQGLCPNFAQHVFAISGVSGGAVGAALFSASLQVGKRVESVASVPSVANSGDGNELEVGLCNPSASAAATDLSGVIRRDHLSPAFALVWPDLARKLLQFLIPDSLLQPGSEFLRTILRLDFDRSSVLERSFACAFDQQAPWQPCHAASRFGDAGLRLPFKDHWSPGVRSPALILTSTWVETGFRAAYAPFPLHAISDGTLFSFHYEAGKSDFQAQGAAIDPTPRFRRSLIEAAFVSARFPGIVPAWQMTTREVVKSRRWNFVDGGYVDNSGATIALELMRKLKLLVDPRFSLYLILLTDADTSADFSEVPDGTRFSDTVAPVSALLSVRAQLASRAVTRAIAELNKTATEKQLAGIGKSDVLVVNLKQKTFQLTLGWKISRTSDDIVRLMLGRREFCDEQLEPSNGRLDAVRVIRKNSCVKKRITDLLRAAPENKAMSDGG